MTTPTAPKTSDPGGATINLHATTVALPATAGRAPQAVLILGASGTGKSELALQMVALGACLVADDRTLVRRIGPRLVASASPRIRGLIEMRGIGILRLPSLAEADLALVVDLDRHETARMPPARHVELLGVALPMLHSVETTCFPSAVMLYLRHGRSQNA